MFRSPGEQPHADGALAVSSSGFASRGLDETHSKRGPGQALCAISWLRMEIYRSGSESESVPAHVLTMFDVFICTSCK
jgi:hypothetical protein